MLTEESIYQLDELTQVQVIQAVAVIAASGVLQLQANHNLIQLASGSLNEPDAVMAERVREYRRRNQTLDSFAALAESFAEKEN